MLIFRMLRRTAFLICIILIQLTCTARIFALECALKESNSLSVSSLRLPCASYTMGFMNNAWVNKINDQPLPIKFALWGSVGLLAAGTMCGLYVGIKKGAQAYLRPRVLPTIEFDIDVKTKEQVKTVLHLSNARQSIDELISRYRGIEAVSEKILNEFIQIADSPVISANERAECFIHMAYLYSESGQWDFVRSLCFDVLRGQNDKYQWRAYALYYLGEWLLQQHERSFYDLNDVLSCFKLALSYDKDGLSDNAKRNVYVKMALIDAALRKILVSSPEFLGRVQTCILQVNKVSL